MWCSLDAHFMIKITWSHRGCVCQELLLAGTMACSEASFQMMAPESLQDGIFSDKTDVVRDQKQYEMQRYAESQMLIYHYLLQWSFGITCWEIFSGGKTPYPGVDLSPWCSCWRMDRGSTNPPTQHALTQCELVIQAISHYHLYAVYIQPRLTAPQLTLISVQLMNGNLVSLMDCLFTYVMQEACSFDLYNLNYRTSNPIPREAISFTIIVLAHKTTDIMLLHNHNIKSKADPQESKMLTEPCV